MMRSLLIRLLPFGLIAACGLASCGGDVTCEEYCPSIENCDQLLNGASCDEFCSQAEAANDQTGCGEEFQEFINCGDDADDACEPVGCLSEIRAYSDCLLCSINPDDPDC
jgi:hypothetical protein